MVAGCGSERSDAIVERIDSLPGSLATEHGGAADRMELQARLTGDDSSPATTSDGGRTGPSGSSWRNVTGVVVRAEVGPSRDAVVHAQLQKDVTDVRRTGLGRPSRPHRQGLPRSRSAAEGFMRCWPAWRPGYLRCGLAIRHRVPTIGNYPYHAENGLLLTYGEAANPLTSAPRNTSTKSCVAPSPAIFRSRGQSSLTSWSISRPRRRWNSWFQSHSCCLPIRSLNKTTHFRLWHF